jgi:hemerythrin-like domain-containing protein
MLTATYALVALSVEQASIRKNLTSFRNTFSMNASDGQATDLVRLKLLLRKINHLHQRCHWRKVDVYLIPAVRKATKQADLLLAELESLSLLGLSVLRSIRYRLQQAIANGTVKIEGLCASVELYCNTMLKKMDKEDVELLALAQQAIPSEQWFQMAQQFLVHDALVYEHDALTVALALAAERPAMQRPKPIADSRRRPLLAMKRRNWKDEMSIVESANATPALVQMQTLRSSIGGRRGN